MQLVSVIIPTYNCGKYVVDAIESVLKQTYGHIEIVVIDDGSTDDTRSILDPYFDRIRYIYQENKGLANARNKGIREAKGEYIAFLDADDRWLSGKIELQIKCFKKLSDIQMVFTNFSAFNEAGNIEGFTYKRIFPIFQENNLTFENIFPEKFNLKHLNGIYKSNIINIYHGNICKALFTGNFILPSSVMVNKSSILETGCFNEEYKVAEETEFLLRFSYKYNIAYIDYPLVKYMLNRPNKLTGKKNTVLLISNAINIQERFIKENPIYYQRNWLQCQKAIGMSYLRLSYYHLSEFQKRKAIKNAILSCKWYPFKMKPYLLIASYLIPSFILRLAKFIKNIFSLTKIR